MFDLDTDVDMDMDMGPESSPAETKEASVSETSSVLVTNGRGQERTSDRLFRVVAVTAASTIMITLAGVAIFLTIESVPALQAGAAQMRGASDFFSYVWPLIFGTVWAAFLALIIATPLSIGVALTISHYAPSYLAKALGYVVDLLAAVPSVVYGLWGIGFLGTRLVPLYDWLHRFFGWLPFFRTIPDPSGRSILTAGVVLAIMILPIVTAIVREVFTRTPELHQEAALALGATRWEMIRMAVLPHARSGIVSALMLGLGRALGETMAVAMTLSAVGVVTFNVIGSANPSTIAANIALNFGESYGTAVNVLIASGLVLFVITFLVNYLARWIVARSEVKA